MKMQIQIRIQNLDETKNAFRKTNSVLEYFGRVDYPKFKNICNNLEFRLYLNSMVIMICNMKTLFAKLNSPIILKSYILNHTRNTKQNSSMP